MQNDILNSAEKLTLLTVIEDLLHVRTIHHFVDWIEAGLQTIFPHRAFICGNLDIQINPIVLKGLLHHNFPLAFLDHCRQRNGLISMPCMRQWAKSGEPQLLDLDNESGVDSASIELYRRFNVPNVAAHGAKSIDGDDASYFSFICVPDLGRRHAYLLKFLVPHMHEVLARVAAADLHSGLRDTQAIPRVTKREQEVLKWMVVGKSNGEIAQILGTSPQTVKNQARKIFEKLHVRNRVQAAAAAVKMGVSLWQGVA